MNPCLMMLKFPYCAHGVRKMCPLTILSINQIAELQREENKETSKFRHSFIYTKSDF